MPVHATVRERRVSMIDPKLKTLLSVVKEGSFTRAAEVLALS